MEIFIFLNQCMVERIHKYVPLYEGGVPPQESFGSLEFLVFMENDLFNGGNP